MSTGHYKDMKALARSVREEHQITGPRLLKSHMRRIYKKHGIQLDYWPGRTRSLRGAYFDDEYGTSVMVAKHLPNDPLIFTLAHELKHHLVDRSRQALECSTENVSRVVEVAAEVFAAELLFPDELFKDAMHEMKIPRDGCKERTLVQLKHETGTTLSYYGLSKKAEFLGFAKPGSIKQGNWRKLEAEMYGVPVFGRRVRVSCAA